MWMTNELSAGDSQKTLNKTFGASCRPRLKGTVRKVRQIRAFAWATSVAVVAAARPSAACQYIGCGSLPRTFLLSPSFSFTLCVRGPAAVLPLNECPIPEYCWGPKCVVHIVVPTLKSEFHNESLLESRPSVSIRLKCIG